VVDGDELVARQANAHALANAESARPVPPDDSLDDAGWLDDDLTAGVVAELQRFCLHGGRGQTDTQQGEHSQGDAAGAADRADHGVLDSAHLPTAGCTLRTNSTLGWFPYRRFNAHLQETCARKMARSAGMHTRT